jgi:hypothetical protein
LKRRNSLEIRSLTFRLAINNLTARIEDACASHLGVRLPGRREITFLRISRFGAALLLLFAGAAAGSGTELQPGVWASRDVSTLPLPISGYQVYLLGEMHGVKEIEGIFIQYLARLYSGTGLRDVAIEEDAVYQFDAQAYVEGRLSAVPEPLCLRAGVIQAIRRFNEGRKENELIRVHLVDIDSPATEIRQHLLAIKERIAGTVAVRVPDERDIKERGLETIDDLKRLTVDEQILGELRTVHHSIRAYQQGLEVGTGQFKGSPYLDDREQAIASNIQDLLRSRDCRAVLALYGSDHVSKARRKDGGAKRDRDFSPLALRLQEAGVRVFSLVTFPLSGRSRWRGHEDELLWTARDGSLADGRTLDRVLLAIPEATLLYVDPRRQRIRLPSRDITAFVVDAFLLLVSATAMENHCATR